ncbi:MAG: DUF4350 domain-containing protein [Planctomycetota bacterium]
MNTVARTLATTLALVVVTLGAARPQVATVPLHSTLALLAALAILLLGGGAGRSWNWQRLAAGLAVAAAGFGVSALGAGVDGAAAAAACWLIAAALVSGAFRPRAETLLPIGVVFGGVAFAAWIVLERHVDAAWFAVQDLGYGYSSLAGWVTGATTRWGPTANGTHGALAALLALGGVLAAGQNASGRRVGLAVAGIALTPLLVLATASAVLPGHPIGKGTFASVLPLLLQVVALPLHAAWIGVGTKSSTAARTNAAPNALAVGRPASLGIGACAAVVVLAVVAWRHDAPAESAPPVGGKVVFVQQNPSLADFNAPTWERMGFASTGLYGSQRQLLTELGYTTEVVGAVPDRATLADVAVLVFICPTETLAPAQLTAVHDYVAAGGGLLVLSDHTDLMGSMGPTNQLLEPVAMELRFDTAMETRRSLIGNLEARATGVLPANLDGLAAQVLHGASLRVAAPARPLLVGTTMFGDFGDRANGGRGAFLGDYALEAHHEQLGDVVLAASADLGRGRVLAFGDTSTFQNTALARSAAVVADLYRWVAGATPRPTPLGAWAGAGLLLLLAAGLVRRLPLGQVAGPAAAVATGMWIVAVAATADRHADADGGRLVHQLGPDRAFVLHGGDVAHWDLDQFQDHSIQGLLTCAARGGMVPLLGDLDDLGDLQSVGVAAVVAPAAPLSAALADRLERRLRDGGTVIVCAGYEESSGVAAFLQRFGLRIGAQPLGAAPVLGMAERRKYGGPRGRESWPVHSDGRLPSTVHFAVDDLAIVREVAVGAGRLAVIGDSWFLSDKNLEGETSHEPANVALLKTLMD